MIKRYRLIPEPDETLKDMALGVAAVLYLLVLLALIAGGVWYLVQALQGIGDDPGSLSAACFAAAGILISLVILNEWQARNRP